MRRIIFPLVTLIVTFALFSFTVNKINNDFLKQLGLSQAQADEKIASSLLGGYLDTYGVRNAKNIALGNRTAVATDLLQYTKKYVGSAAFAKEYASLKEKNKPKPNPVITPEEMRAQTIASIKQGMTEIESYIRKADPSQKKIYEPLLEEGKKRLADAEDPNNKTIANYTRNYPALVKSSQANQDRALQKWEAAYPANPALFIKERLQRFLSATEGIDYSAELVARNNKKVFANPAYENKSNYWKMGFRAGKEVTETARTFVTNWLQEIQ